jgi:hypothetical protein
VLDLTVEVIRTILEISVPAGIACIKKLMGIIHLSLINFITVARNVIKIGLKALQGLFHVKRFLRVLIPGRR